MIQNYFGGIGGSRAKREMKNEWFGSYIMHDFEDIQIRIPFLYDEYLTKQYGNWRELPPENQRVSVDNLFKVDLNKSYLEYIKH